MKNSRKSILVRLRVLTRALDAWTLRTMNPSGVLLCIARKDFSHRAEERDEKNHLRRTETPEHQDRLRLDDCAS